MIQTVNEQFLFNVQQEVQKRFPNGLPLLDPVEDMGIKEKSMKDVVKVTSDICCTTFQVKFINIGTSFDSWISLYDHADFHCKTSLEK